MAEPILPPESADAHAHLREPSNLRRARFMVVDFPSVRVDWAKAIRAVDALRDGMASAEWRREYIQEWPADVIEGEFTVSGNNPARR